MYQQTTVIGFVGQDATMRYTQSGTAVTSFSVATSRKWTGADGQRQEETTWFKVTTWNKLAANLGEFVKKGSQVMVVGEMQAPKIWTDRDGNPRADLELTARTVKFLGSKPSVDASDSRAAHYAGPSSLKEEEEVPF